MMSTSQATTYSEFPESGQRAYSLSIRHAKSRYPDVLRVLPRKTMILSNLEASLTQETLGRETES